MEVNIRKASTADAAALGEILRSVDWFTNLIEMPDQDLHASITRGLQQCLADDSHLILVAETGLGRILGYVSVHWLPYLFLDGPEGHVSEIFVHKAARGSGIGKKLLQAVKNAAHQRGCSRLMLVNGRTRESYQRDFYKKDGWRERETMANFIYELKD